MEKLKCYVKTLVGFLFGIHDVYDHSFLSFRNENPIIVDLGAGEGRFTAQILEGEHCSRIILVEPDPVLAKRLEGRFKTQGNIKILDVAIGGCSIERVNFYLANNYECNTLYSSFYRLQDENGTRMKVSVRMITLEDIFELYRLPEIDLLKMDIEGAEWDVLEKFTKRDYERIHQISVEFHDFLDSSQRWRSEECIKRLERLGYSFISKGTSYKQGTPYYNCLFYDRKYLSWNSILRWLRIESLPFRFQKLITNQLKG